MVRKGSAKTFLSHPPPPRCRIWSFALKAPLNPAPPPSGETRVGVASRARYGDADLMNSRLLFKVIVSEND